MTMRIVAVGAGVIAAGAIAAGAQGLAGATTAPAPKSAMVQVVTAPAVQPKAGTAVTPTALTAPAAASGAPVTDTLPPLDLRTMRLWNWSGVWHASEWSNAESPIPWRYNRVVQPARADTFFTLDAGGAPQLQAQGGMAAAASGLWETEVTLPTLRDGLIVAPLWLYDPASRDEIDFEFAGRKGLDVTMHVYVNGVHKQSTTRLFAGRDMSGQRRRFGIKVDQAAGSVEMFVDSVRVHAWQRNSMSFFVSKPLKPWIEMWAADPKNPGYVQWAGRWSGTGSTVMNVHGYRFMPSR